MKKVFAKTSNVTSFVAAMTRLMSCDEGIPRMALIYSHQGLGKTRTSIWWAAQINGVFIRTKKIMSARWLLEEIVSELGESPMRRISDIFRQSVDQLLENPRPIFIDEVDRYGIHGDIVETLRDLHDVTNNPLIFIGMDQARKKFMRHPFLFSRFSEVLEFKPFSVADVRAIADQLCEVQIADDAITYIHSQTKGLREIKVQLYKAEGSARTNSLKEVTMAHLIGAKR